ncbi:MAG TPA: hypothetical protein VGB91_14550 [Rhizomicrobium sp.]
MRRGSTAAMLAVSLLLAGCGKPPPTDRAMAAEFAAKRAVFEAMRADLCKLKYDQTVMRDPPWAQPQMALADELHYRAALAALHATGVKYIRGCQLWIEMWSSGVGRDAAYKKYRYGPPLYRVIEIKEPPPKDLNGYLDRRVSIASFQKNLEGDWWIELDHWQ